MRGSIIRSTILSATLLAWFATSAFAQTENVLANGGFDSAQAPWRLFSDGSHALDVSGDLARVIVTLEGDDVQLHQANLNIERGVAYRLTFDAWNTQGNDLRAQLLDQAWPFSNYGLDRVFPLEAYRKSFQFTFTTPDQDLRPARFRFRFGFFDSNGSEYFVDNVSLKAIAVECGDGVIGPGEQCDDGNAIADDGCSETCQIVGVPGPQGPAGPAGPVGPQGPQGVPGLDATQDPALQAAVCRLYSEMNVDDPPSFCMRLTDNGDGTVTDTETGLTWLKNANCVTIPKTDDLGKAIFKDAQDGVALLEHGTCGLTDGSQPGDWRLPTLPEWELMIQQAESNGCLSPGPFIMDTAGSGCWSEGDPFVNVLPAVYWSSTSDGGVPPNISLAVLFYGNVFGGSPYFKVFVWPVRD